MDVEEDDVDALFVVGPGVQRAPDQAQRIGGPGGALGAADPRIGAQQVQELLQGGGFVVDGQYAQHAVGL